MCGESISVTQRAASHADHRNILHDEATYPDPFAFNPDRYADAKTNTERGINDVPWAAFGFGRR